MNAKWTVEVTGSIEVEAEDEDEAIGLAQSKILESPDMVLTLEAGTDWQQCQGCMDWFAPDDSPLSDDGLCVECEEDDEEEEEEEEAEDDDEESD